MRRDELVEEAAALGRRFATRAAKFDSEAGFPYEDFADSFAAYFQHPRRDVTNPTKWTYIDAFLLTLKSTP